MDHAGPYILKELPCVSIGSVPIHVVLLKPSSLFFIVVMQCHGPLSLFYILIPVTRRSQWKQWK